MPCAAVAAKSVPENASDHRWATEAFSLCSKSRRSAARHGRIAWVFTPTLEDHMVRAVTVKL